MTDQPPPKIVQHADDAFQSIRAINHLPTIPLPAPVVYEVIGNLKNVGHQLPQVLEAVTAGLRASVNTHDLYEDGGGDPAVSVAQAWDHLVLAARLAAEFGQELEAARSAIAGQGFRENSPG